MKFQFRFGSLYGKVDLKCTQINGFLISGREAGIEPFWLIVAHFSVYWKITLCCTKLYLKNVIKNCRIFIFQIPKNWKKIKDALFGVWKRVYGCFPLLVMNIQIEKPYFVTLYHLWHQEKISYWFVEGNKLFVTMSNLWISRT